MQYHLNPINVKNYISVKNFPIFPHLNNKIEHNYFHTNHISFEILFIIFV